jgi:WD40 repeat protein
LPGYGQAKILGFVPGEYPIYSLASVLVRSLNREAELSLEEVDRFSRVLRKTNESGYFDSLLRIAIAKYDNSPLIILVDQFEEVFSLCKDSAEKSAFINNLLVAAASSSKRVSVIVTLRSDFLAETQSYSLLNQIFSKQGYLVPAMVSAELRQAISLPAENAGYPLDVGTVQLLVEQSEGREGILPLLQFALTRIWEGLRQGVEPAVTLSEIGGVGGALAQEAQRIYDSLDEAEQAIARRVFLGLVQLGEGAQDTRRRVNLSSLVAHQEKPEQVRQVIDQFASPGARLITLSGNETGEETAEVTHEALITHWQLYCDWLDKGRDDLRFQRRLEEAVHYWHSHSKQRGLLWRRPDLDLLRSYYQRFQDQITELQLEFYNSAVRQERQQHLWQATGVGLLALFAASMTWFGVQSSREEKLALARQLATQAQQLSAQPQPNSQATGALLAVHAFHPVNHTFQELSVVNQALRHSLDQLPLATLSHDDRVEAVTFSPNGQQVATTSEDGPARLWEASSGKLIATLRHDREVTAVTFSPDGQQVATASRDDTARLWETSNGKLIATLSHDDLVTAVTFSPNGQQVATASWDHTVRLWEASNGELIATLSHGDRVEAVTFSPNGQQVATASRDGTARVWKASNGELIATLSHDDSVEAVTFSPNGQQVATTSRRDRTDEQVGPAWDYTVRLWEASSGELIATLNHDDSVEAVTFSPNGQQVATTSWDYTVRLWEASSGELITTLNHDDSVNAVTFSLDGQQVATASGDNTARVWKAGNGILIATLNHDDYVNAVTFSPDGQQVATASQDGTARLWEASDGELIATLNHGDGINAVTFSPDGQQVATASQDGTARLWETRNGKLSINPSDNPSENYTFWDILFSPNGQQVVTFSSESEEVWLWATSSRKLVATLNHDSGVNAVTFSLDGQQVSTASGDNTARVWKAGNGELIATLNHDDVVNAVTFSPDGQQVATASQDGTARVWKVGSGELIATLNHDDEVNAVTFSSDGQQAATASQDGTARVWKVGSGELIATLSHDDGVNAVTFSPNGQQVVTNAGSDGKVRLWETHSGGKLIAIFEHEGNAVTAEGIEFSLDGQRLATVSMAGLARLWEVSSGKLISTLNNYGEVTAVTFSADGQQVATAHRDDRARLWKADSGELIATLNHDAWVSVVQFSPNGHQLATMSLNGKAWVWNADSGEPVATLDHGRYLTLDHDRFHSGFGGPEFFAVTFSADGQRLVTASSDGKVQIHWVWSRDLVKGICERLDRNFSAAEWTNYMQTDMNKYTLTCPNLPVHPTVIRFAHNEAMAGKINQSTTLLRHLLKISQVAGHEIDLDQSTDELDKSPRAVALKYSAHYLIQEATTFAQNGNTFKAVSLLKQALIRSPEIDGLNHRFGQGVVQPTSKR